MRSLRVVIGVFEPFLGSLVIAPIDIAVDSSPSTPASLPSQNA